MGSSFFCLALLLLSLSFTSAYLSLRDSSSPSIGDWRHNFGSDPNAANLNLNAPTRLLFPAPDNSSEISVGEVLFQCLPDGQPQYDPSIPIEITIHLQKLYQIYDVYIWIGIQGTNPTNPDYTTWTDDSTAAGNGVTFVNTGLNDGHSFERNITLGSLSSILNNADGTPRTCFRVIIYVDARRYCGFTHRPNHLTYSPPGCDTNYQAIYPSNSSYFTVGVNHEDYPQFINNGTTFYEGYCLTPTRDIDPNYSYNGITYSSYDPAVLGSYPGDFVEVPAALPLINYIINHEAEYKSSFLGGYQCTWQDIQYVIWIILNPSVVTSDPVFYDILTNSTAECRQFIYNDAETNGQNYIPPCPGGKFLLILYPIVPGSNCVQDNSTQIIAFPWGSSCLNKCQPQICEDVLRTYGRFCLTGQCAPPTSSSPASISMSNLPIVPSESPSSYASRSNSRGPSESHSTYASMSNSRGPSESRTTHPSGSRYPSESRTSRPSESPCPSESRRPSESRYPSESRTSHPSSTHTAAPSQSRSTHPSHSSYPSVSISSKPVVPSETRSTHPSASRTSHPSESRAPSASRTSHPSGSRAPSASRTSHPSESRAPSASRTSHPSGSSRPSESRTSRPSESPCPSESTRPSESRYPSESRTSHPSESSRPSESRTSHPSYSSKPVVPSETHTARPSESRCPSESTRPSESRTSRPSESPCPSESSRPSESRTSYPSHSSAASHTPYPSHSTCHESQSASHSPPCHDMGPSASASHSPCEMGHPAPSPSPSPCEHMGGGPGGDRPGM